MVQQLRAQGWEHQVLRDVITHQERTKAQKQSNGNSATARQSTEIAGQHEFLAYPAMLKGQQDMILPAHSHQIDTGALKHDLVRSLLFHQTTEEHDLPPPLLSLSDSANK